MIIFGIVASQQTGDFSVPTPESAAWRLLVHETQNHVTDTTIMINEIVWLDEAGDPIDVSTAFITAHASEGSNGPLSCFDGLDETYWAGPRDDGTIYGTTGWLQTVWDDPVEVRGIKIKSAELNMDNAPAEFSIQYQTESGAWVTLFKVVAQEGWDPLELRSFRMGGRVWRLEIETTEEGSKVAVGEIEFRSVENVGEQHHTAGGHTIASAEDDDETRFNAFDGNVTTIWSADTLPATIEYWFQTAKPVEQVAIFAAPGREDEAPLTTKLYRSDDYGLTWIEEDAIPVFTISSGYGLGYGYYYGG